LYHNHDFEFKKVGNKSIYEHFISYSDPKLVGFEMDLYWVVSGGENPVALFKKYPNRFPLWHVKDMDKVKKVSTEVGNGRIDFKTIFANAKLAGLDVPVVEQEDFTGTSIDSAKTCLVNLKKLKV
ncbi:MAG TPA: sugar phosphate isomerase/epimerase, partial [Cytophagaceae bacterium]